MARGGSIVVVWLAKSAHRSRMPSRGFRGPPVDYALTNLVYTNFDM
jgi:hypothetical protein